VPWKRRPFSGDISRAVNISDLRVIAQRRVPHFIFEYVEGGAEDEATLRSNRSSFESWKLIPQTLVDTSKRTLRTEILGQPSAAPLIIGPTGGNGLLSPNGDIALARAANRAGVPFTLSTMSNARLEDVAKQAGGRLWMQLYVTKNRAIAEDVMARAASAGYEALVFTTDANLSGNREWDRRSYLAPGKPTLRARLDALRHPQWLSSVILRNGIPRFRNVEAFLPPGAGGAVGGSTIIPRLFEPTITWDDITWIRRHWPRKLLIKGVLSVPDAERAAALGCEGIVLTNHGGRQLDHCVSAIDVLPEIVAAVGKRMTIIADGGFRRGTDIVKAVALGANGVMTGRATLYGLAANGERGVARALEILMTEMDRAIGHLGLNSVADLGPHMLRRSGLPQ
jgi:(S)-mandelate dehydrogenase